MTFGVINRNRAKIERERTRAKDYVPASRSPDQIPSLHKYLRKFGYMRQEPRVPTFKEVETDARYGLKRFQTFRRLPVTGQLNAQVLDAMSLPRCGNIERITSPIEFAFLGAKWTYIELTYAFENFTPDLTEQEIRDAVGHAFDEWSSYTTLFFEEVPFEEPHDINIRFASGDHEGSLPGYPAGYGAFDGAGGVLGHCYPPPGNTGYPASLAGDCHFDETETWRVATVENPTLGPGEIDLVTVALHEIGHGLGMAHSAVEDSVMWPDYTGPYQLLQQDDIDGIQRLYGTAEDVIENGISFKKIQPRATLSLSQTNAWERITLNDVPPGPGFAYGRVENPGTTARIFGTRLPFETAEPKNPLKAGSVMGIVLPFDASHQAEFFREVADMAVRIQGYLTGTEVVVLPTRTLLTGGSGSQPTYDVTPYVGDDAGNVALIITRIGDANVSNFGIGYPGTTLPITTRSVQGPTSMFAFVNELNEVHLMGANPELLGYVIASDDITRNEGLVGTIVNTNYKPIDFNLPSNFYGFYYIESTVAGANWELRPLGSTDEHYRGLSHQHTYAICDGDTEGRLEIRSNQTATRFWQLGTARSTSDSPPDAPILLSPAHNENSVSLTPTLAWAEDERATSYRLRVSANTDFSQIIKDVTGPGTNYTFALSERFNYSATLHWAVIAINDKGSNQSTYRTFTTQAQPTVAITSPADGATVFGTTAVSAAATGTGLTGVQFKRNSVNLGLLDDTAPYTRDWDTAAIPDGQYVLTAIVADAFSSISSAPRTVTVSNALRATITEPIGGSVVTGIVEITAITAGPSISGVSFSLDGVAIGVQDITAPYSMSWNSSTVADGSHTLRATVVNPSGSAISPPVEIVVVNTVIGPELVNPTMPSEESEEENLMFYNPGETPVITFQIVSTVNYATPVTTGSPTMEISKNGGSYAPFNGPVTHIGNGTWKIQLSASHTDTSGDLRIAGNLADAYIKPIVRHVRSILQQANVDASIAAAFDAPGVEPPAGPPQVDESIRMKLERLFRELRNRRVYVDDGVFMTETLFKDNGTTPQYKRRYLRQQVGTTTTDIREEAEAP